MDPFPFVMLGALVTVAILGYLAGYLHGNWRGYDKGERDGYEDAKITYTGRRS